MKNNKNADSKITKIIKDVMILGVMWFIVRIIVDILIMNTFLVENDVGRARIVTYQNENQILNVSALLITLVIYLYGLFTKRR